MGMQGGPWGRARGDWGQGQVPQLQARWGWGAGEVQGATDQGLPGGEHGQWALRDGQSFSVTRHSLASKFPLKLSHFRS